MREQQRCSTGNSITKVLHAETQRPSRSGNSRADISTSTSRKRTMYSLAFTDPRARREGEDAHGDTRIGIQPSRPIPSTCRSGSYLDSSPDKQTCSLAVRAFRQASTPPPARATLSKGVCVSQQPLGAWGTGQGAGAVRLLYARQLLSAVTIRHRRLLHGITVKRAPLRAFPP
jgi:hypothetical protein